MATTSGPPARSKAKSCGPLRPSRRARWRAASLIAVHAVVAAHIAHWKVSGRTLTPVEPSEAVQTLELGYVNAGFVVFLFLVLSTLVLGRFFCGWACHVVAYQDLCAWLLAKLGLKPRPVRSRLLMLVPLGAACYMFGGPLVRRWLEGTPSPAMVAHFTTTDFWATFPDPLVGVLTLFIAGGPVVWWLGAKGFCTYGCPYGGIFGVVDRFAAGRIRVTDACEGCGHCTATCTSNVRVHEEVARHGMVVDPGCMKCMDCVSVCPKEALYFGFGAPSLATKSAARRKGYDFSWPEEIALAVVFAAALFAYNGLYHQVPLLMALGLSVLTTTAVVTAVRIVRRPDLTFQHMRLKAAGRLTRAGRFVAAGLALFLALGLHSLYVQFSVWRGDAALRTAAALAPAQWHAALRASREQLSRAERAGLFTDPSLLYRLGVIDLELGDLPLAEASLRRAAEVETRDPSPALALADLLLRRGKVAEAEVLLRGLLARDPDLEPAQQMMRAAEGLRRGAPK
jgi:polyferredoxin